MDDSAINLFVINIDIVMRGRFVLFYEFDFFTEKFKFWKSATLNDSYID